MPPASPSSGRWSRTIPEALPAARAPRPRRAPRHRRRLPRSSTRRIRCPEEMDAAESKATGALQLAQQRASLWADAAQRVYALIVSTKVGGLRERLAHGDVGD